VGGKRGGVEERRFRKGVCRVQKRGSLRGHGTEHLPRGPKGGGGKIFASRVRREGHGKDFRNELNLMALVQFSIKREGGKPDREGVMTKRGIPKLQGKSMGTNGERRKGRR